MDPALLTSVPLNSGVWVDDGEFGGVGCDGDVGDGNDADDGEECSGGFPALGTPTGVVVQNVAAECYFDFVGGTVAMEFSAGEGGASFGDAVVN